MELKFKTSCENILVHRGDCTILLENWPSPSIYLTEIATRPDFYKPDYLLIEYIQVYKRLSGPDILGMNIGVINNKEEYLYKISLAIEAALSKYENRINIFLCDTLNFDQFAEAMANYCEKNSKLNLNLCIFSTQAMHTHLESVFHKLKKKVRQQQKEISHYLFRSLTCIKCEGFAYSPTMLKCCSSVLCEKCSQNWNNCPRCNSIEKTEDLSIMLKQILNHAPYYCKCEQKIHYSEKILHQRTCTYPNFKCKICTGVFTYNELAQHFQDSHIDEVVSEKLFN